MEYNIKKINIDSFLIIIKINFNIHFDLFLIIIKMNNDIDLLDIIIINITKINNIDIFHKIIKNEY